MLWMVKSLCAKTRTTVPSAGVPVKLKLKKYIVKETSMKQTSYAMVQLHSKQTAPVFVWKRTFQRSSSEVRMAAFILI